MNWAWAPLALLLAVPAATTIRSYVDVAEKSGYKVEGLLDAARLTLARERD